MSNMNSAKEDHDNNGKHNGQTNEFVHKFGRLDSNAIDPTTGFMYDGSGNSADHFNIADNLSEHVEVALKVKTRFGADQPYTLDGNGDPVYTEHPGNTGTTEKPRANWNFDYSADTAFGGIGETLNDYTFKITVAETGTSHPHSETFDLMGDHMWVSETNAAHVFGGDDFDIGNQHNVKANGRLEK